MLIVRGWDDPFPPGPPVYAAFGVFDGVHLGHRKVLGDLVAWARSEQGRAVVVTFRRHPHSVISGRRPPFLTALQHRLELFSEIGVDVSVVLAFDEKLAAMEPEDFARELLSGWLGARGVVVGYDQRFGKAGRGDALLMRRMGEELGFEVRQEPPFVIEGRIVSSTAIREAIQRGNLREASLMLGRPVSVLGRVVHGQGKGRDLGCPTANLDLRGELHLPEGVYLGRALLAGREHGAVINIGRRPSFGANGLEYIDREPVVEAHLLGFDDDLYGKEVEVQFLEKLRDEKRFGASEELREQLRRDMRLARERLALD